MRELLLSTIIIVVGAVIGTTVLANKQLNEANETYDGKCIRVLGWFFPAQVNEVHWFNDYSAPWRTIQVLLQNPDAIKLSLSVTSIADGETATVNVSRSVRLQIIQCKMDQKP